MVANKQDSRAGRPSEAELEKAEKPGPPARLTATERKLVAEALRRAEETRNVMEDSLVGYGRWLLVQVFDDDASAALTGRHDNAVWRDLLARAGGPTLRLSERLLYVALHIAAHDKRINDESWRNLEPGRKELLLPLPSESLMREAAQHVTEMKLTQRATRSYVSALLEREGERRKLRLTPGRINAHVRGFRERVTRADYQRSAVATLKKADAEEVKKVREEVAAVRDWATGFLAKLKAGSGR